MRVVAAERGTPLRSSERKIGTAEQSHTGRRNAATRAVNTDATGFVGNTRAIRAGEMKASMSSATNTPRSRKGIACRVMPTAIVAARPTGRPDPAKDPCAAHTPISASRTAAPISAPQGRGGLFVSITLTPQL